ncbi:MAG: hypothetical protein HZA81_01360 [Candidatus Taylorbacteria bacterium]|nr:hypothetical protein [Candidatus Taylorbacteria bacterium]
MKNALHSNIRILAAGTVIALISAFAFQTNAQTVTGGVTGTLSATSTSATSTEFALLQGRIDGLESEVDVLRAEVATLRATVALLMGQIGSGGTGGSGTTTATTSSSVSVSPQGASVRAGTSIDFSGRGFWYDEPVRVTDASGAVVGTARADGGGNFSTGSLPVSSATGSRSYTFTGGWSGMSKTVSFTVTQ